MVPLESFSHRVAISRLVNAGGTDGNSAIFAETQPERSDFTSNHYYSTTIINKLNSKSAKDVSKGNLKSVAR